MQALAERTGAFFVRHATVPHQMTFNHKFGTEQCAALLLRQHKNRQGELEEGPPLWCTAGQIENAKAASMPAPAPSFAVNEAAHTSWVARPNISWAQHGKGSKYELLSYTWNDYSGLRTAPASGDCPRREDSFAEAGSFPWLKLVLCALGAASLVGSKSKTKPCR